MTFENTSELATKNLVQKYASTYKAPHLSFTKLQIIIYMRIKSGLNI